MTLLVEFVRLSAARRRLLMEATMFLAVARLAIVVLPFRRIAPYLGTCMAEVQAPAGRDNTIIQSVAWAVEAAAGRAPWRALCLPRAMAAKFMLRRRGIGSTLYLGVASTGAGSAQGLGAHAWLRVQGRVVTGGGGDLTERHVVLGIFT